MLENQNLVTDSILLMLLPNRKAIARLPNNTSLGHGSDLEQIIMGAKRDLNLTLQNIHHLPAKHFLVWEFLKCGFREVICKVPDEIDIYDEKWSTDFTKVHGDGSAHLDGLLLLVDFRHCSRRSCPP